MNDFEIEMTQQRYSKNPFVRDMIIPVGKQSVTLSTMGRDDNILVNQSTGEVVGSTHVVTHKKVDGEQFIKLFTANIALTFDLKSSGIKALSVLLWIMQKKFKPSQPDLICLDSFALDEFLENHSDKNPPLKMSAPTFRRGLSELENAKIIAKNVRRGWYFINPNFAFNGNRIAFSTLIERVDSDSNNELESN